MRIDHPRARRTVALGLTAGALAATLAGCSGAADARPQASPTGTTSGTTSASPSSGTSGGTSGADGVGDWPSFLPSPSASSMATGSVDQPAVSYPGAPVLVRLGSTAVRVDLDGPSYPASTKVGADQVPCTFTVTFSAAADTTGADDLGSAHLDVLTHDGKVHPLKAGAGTGWPRSITPGGRAVVRLQATLPSGEGFVRFYPSGSRAAAGWDYVAETD